MYAEKQLPEPIILPPNKVSVYVPDSVFMIAMAMQETQTMSPGERDWTKDCTIDGSANYSMFNINSDFVKFVTGSDPPPSLPLVDNSAFINPGSIEFVVDTINRAIDKATQSLAHSFLHAKVV